VRISNGQRLRSQVDGGEFIVVRALDADVDLRCGGAVVIGAAETPAAEPEIQPFPDAPPPRLGKRYTDPSGTLELLVTKAGSYAVTLDGVALEVRESKPLPASD
jgi:hypothetical protein